MFTSTCNVSSNSGNNELPWIYMENEDRQN